MNTANTSAQSVEEIFYQQQANAPAIGLTTAGERIVILKRIVAYLKEHAQTLQQAMYQDLRRAPLDTLAELLMVKSEAEFAIQNLHKWLQPHKVKTSLMSKGTKPYLLYEPKGVTLVIGPWNAPLACNLVPMIGSLAAGNTVIIKPSEFSVHTSAALKKMIEQLFLPNYVALIEGNEQTASQLLALPFDHIYFTGSPRVGRIVLQAAAQHLTPVTLELGGKSPTIVDETADIRSAALKIAWGKCANSGQACVAPDYVLVHQSVYQNFVEEVKQAIQTMYNPQGKGIQQSEAFCRIINQHHFKRALGLIDDAIGQGATLTAGGEHDETECYLAPTVLTDVTPDMRVMQEEIFAPIMPIMPFTNKEAVIEIIKKQPKPLALYIYSANRQHISYFLRHTSAGSTVINHNMIQAGVNPYLPFGGVQNSGMGRSVGFATFAAFANQRSVVENPTGWSDFSTISLPPYSTVFRKMIHYLFYR
ncbi:MAG TPA: aldehyde dehydrogenase family protein [Chitinophagales bacterium]|nr:aldehyde dehydrogenase family protein [Chitinophagales bacterium]